MTRIAIIAIFTGLISLSATVLAKSGHPSYGHPHTNTSSQQKINAIMQTGSLRSNIIRIAKRYGWSHVIWKLPNDYRWVGNVAISATTLAGIFKKMLAGYPVQATFYQGNHILVLTPRTLQ